MTALTATRVAGVTTGRDTISENFNRIAASAEKTLSAPERYMLLTDALSGLHANTLQASDFMNLAGNLRDDPSTDVMDQLTNYLQFTGEFLVNDLIDRNSKAGFALRSVRWQKRWAGNPVQTIQMKRASAAPTC